MQTTKSLEEDSQTLNDVISSYDLQADEYDDLGTEAFYLNQYDYYDKHLNSLKQYIRGNVLDLGCGTGLQIPFLSQFAKRIYGIDVAHSLLLKAQEKFSFQSNIVLLQGDATNLPFPDSYFDFISSFGEVISHIPDYEKAFSEMRRVLKPGGVIAFSVLNKWNFHLMYHPKELKDALFLRKKGQWRKWECVYNRKGGRVSLKLKTFSFSELNTILRESLFEPLQFMGAHVLSLIIPLGLQYGRINFWGKLFRTLGKADHKINTKFPFYKLGYHILVGAKSIKIT